jgi:hypothetical protein
MLKQDPPTLGMTIEKLRKRPKKKAALGGGFFSFSFRYG